MSLLNSQHAIGTNGNHPQHIEHNISHYHFPNQTKSRFRFLIYFHFLLVLIVFLQILTYRLPFLTTLDIPRPHLWQYLWLISSLASICGLLSLNKNHYFLMKIFYYGTIIFGLGTILITILLNLNELFTFKRLKKEHHLDEIEPQTFLGLPLLVLWYIFLIITVQIHAYSLYMSNILLHNWQQYKSVKQNHH